MRANGNAMNTNNASLHTVFDGFITELFGFFFIWIIELIHVDMAHNA